MTLTKIVLLVFMAFEAANVIALYLAPGAKVANAVGVFTAWEKTKQDPDVHAFVRYLIYWVAGAKLIFLALLSVILLFGDLTTQRMSVLALALATLSFYWRMFPLIRNMDRKGQLEPENYSQILGVMILVFVAAFLTAFLL